MKFFSSYSFGFTLIEIIVTIAIIGIISSIGASSFVSYNQRQTVKRAAEDVASLLLVARSNALSQVKPNIAPCGPGSVQPLNGYKVKFNSPAANDYSLVAVCGGVETAAISTKKLPGNVSFSSAPLTDSSPYFRTLTNVVDNPVTVFISGFNNSQSQQILIKNDGTIQIQ